MIYNDRKASDKFVDFCLQVCRIAQALISFYGEEAKIAIRNVRRDANDAIKKDKELPEDEQKQTLEESQKLTDKYIKDVDSICEAKKKEILNV